MAEKCPTCKKNIFKFEKITECPECKTKYHDYCWNCFTEKCYVCGKTKEELALGQKEINAKYLAEEERRRQDADVKRLAEEQTRQKAEQEKYQARINHLKATGRDGYYEYKVISIVDKKGAVDTERLMNELNDLGLDGWRLQCAYTNEMGKDALSIAGFGINATADQNILIFERFVKFE